MSFVDPRGSGAGFPLLRISLLVLATVALIAACGSSTSGGASGFDNGGTGSGGGSGANGSSGSGTGSGNTGSGATGSGNTGSGNTGSGATGSGSTGSGSTGSGSTGSGSTGNVGTTGGSTGSSTTGTTGSSGTASSGNSSPSDAGLLPDGAVAQPSALTCSGQTIAAADVISDFNPADSQSPFMYQTGGRGGTLWYAYGADDAASGAKGATTPGVGSNAFAIDPTVAGPCGTNGALKISSTGNTGYGVGFGVNVQPDVAGTTPLVHGTYDASAYSGVGFWMKCSAETQFVFFKVPDAENDPQASGNSTPCVYSGTGSRCNQYGVKNNIIPTSGTGWNYYPMYFSETLQDPNTPAPYGNGMDPKKLASFQVQVNSKYSVGSNGTAGAASPNSFTCWIADVHFLKTAAPAAITTSPGYTVSGNKILDSTGAAHLFKGLGRPSLEWDLAGFGVTREDFQRIKAWGSKVNVVRISLNQAFYVPGQTGYNALYPKYVDRVVQWALDAGLDVILDLHWGVVGTGFGQLFDPDATSVKFWQALAPKYANNGRVIFELYNEPEATDAGTWKTAMQPVYNAAYAIAPKTLMLLGGLNYSYDLSTVVGTISGPNIAYVTHPYIFKAGNNGISDQTAFIAPSNSYPVVATEFGDATISSHTTSCSASTFSTYLSTFASHNIGFTGYAWYVGDCGYPSLLSDYSGTPSTIGTAVKSALQ